MIRTGSSPIPPRSPVKMIPGKAMAVAEDIALELSMTMTLVQMGHGALLAQCVLVKPCDNCDGSHIVALRGIQGCLCSSGFRYGFSFQAAFLLCELHQSPAWLIGVFLMPWWCFGTDYCVRLLSYRNLASWHRRGIIRDLRSAKSQQNSEVLSTPQSWLDVGT